MNQQARDDAADVLIDLDSGGTFTDATVSTADTVHAVKVLTTPHDLTQCFREALDAAARTLGTEPRLLMGRTRTIRFSGTVGTNAVIERRGPRVGLLVDAQAGGPVDGATDDLVAAILSPSADRVRTVEVGGHDDEEQVLRSLEQLLAAGAERVVVALGGQAPRATERRLRRAVFARYPRHVLGAVPILLSTDVAGEDDLTRRMPTAILNAYLHPSLEHFLFEAEDILRERGCPHPLLVFGNDGTSNRVAKVTALRTYNSGPVGGLQGAAQLCRHYAARHGVGVDIGGTSTDLSFVVDGEGEYQQHGDVAGTPTSLTMRRVQALGGGGGTIAHVDDGELRLGPRSAGAAPGPACYGFGGTAPTVTDANLLLGIYDADRPLAGGVGLDVDRARAAIAEHVAAPLGIEALAAALRVRRMLEQRIADAIAAGARERGLESAELLLVAFGGAGPAHAVAIADLLGSDRVLVPALSSVLSSYGVSSSDVEHRYEAIAAADAEARSAVRAALERRARIDMRGEGFAGDDTELSWDESAREDGQLLVTLRAVGRLPHSALTEHSPNGHGAPRPSGSRDVTWSEDGAVSSAVYAAADLHPGATVEGPAIVTSEVLTMPVPPGWVVTRDHFDQFFLTKRG